MTPASLCVGLLAGVGLWAVMLRLPALRRPTLEDRVGPYLRDTPRPSSLLLDDDPVVSPFPTLERLLRPTLRGFGARLERVIGGGASIQDRLDRAGMHRTVEEFRVQQVVWGVGGAGAGLAMLLLLLAAGKHLSAVALLFFVVAGGIAGVLARDVTLGTAVKAREQAMTAEFPTIAELLALAVSAGESPIGALERVARLSQGELAREVRTALADARTGASLVQALDGMARRTGLAPLARFVDGLAVAVERGTPLAEVLRAQATDVREASRRALLDLGGKKEIAMLVPVVFLILPVVVVFALYPGVIGITSVVHP